MMVSEAALEECDDINHSTYWSHGNAMPDAGEMLSFSGSLTHTTASEGDSVIGV